MTRLVSISLLLMLLLSPSRVFATVGGDILVDRIYYEGKMTGSRNVLNADGSVNDIGYRAYREKKYDIAMEYFTLAHGWFSEKNRYLLPLYNLACTLSLTGDTAGALDSLRELLSHETTCAHYLAKIRKDPDFDPIREGDGFKKLLDTADAP